MPTTINKGGIICWEDNPRALDYLNERKEISQSQWIEPKERIYSFLHLLSVALTSKTSIEQEFMTLARKWKEETVGLSTGLKRFMNINYLHIIGMGAPVVSLLLNDMQQTSEHWFLALRAITREDPINPDDYGNVPKMIESWLRWGRGKQYI